MKAAKLRIRITLHGSAQIYRLDRDYEYVTPDWDHHISTLFQMWVFHSLTEEQMFDTFDEALTFLLDR